MGPGQPCVHSVPFHGAAHDEQYTKFATASRLIRSCVNLARFAGASRRSSSGRSARAGFHDLPNLCGEFTPSAGKPPKDPSAPPFIYWREFERPAADVLRRY